MDEEFEMMMMIDRERNIRDMANNDDMIDDHLEQLFEMRRARRLLHHRDHREPRRPHRNNQAQEIIRQPVIEQEDVQ